MIRDRLAGFVTEYLAHLWLRLACLLVMHQAALLDGSALDALPVQQDVPSPAEIDISRARAAGPRRSAMTAGTGRRLLPLGG